MKKQPSKSIWQSNYRTSFRSLSLFHLSLCITLGHCFSLMEAGSTLHQYSSLWRGEKQRPRTAAFFFFFFFFFFSEKVLRSYTYQFYFCPTGSNFIMWPLNECLYEYWRERGNARDIIWLSVPEGGVRKAD